MSEDVQAVPTPWVLDISVLVEVARGDTRTMTLVQELDARGRPLVIPALAVTGASLDIHSDEAAELLEGLERLKNAMTAALRDAEQAVRLAAVIARTGLDPWDAHVAAVADAAVCPILTHDAARWREHAADLDEPLHFIEIADPDEAPGGSGPGALGARSDTRPCHLAAVLACFSVTEAAPARHISQAAGRTGPGGGHTAPAYPAPPLCAGYAVGQQGVPAGLELESTAMAARQTAPVQALADWHARLDDVLPAVMGVARLPSAAVRPALRPWSWIWIPGPVCRVELRRRPVLPGRGGQGVLPGGARVGVSHGAVQVAGRSAGLQVQRGEGVL